RLIAGKDTLKQSFEVKLDPRVETAQGELQEQLDFLLKIRDKLSATDEAINSIRDIKKQTDDVSKRAQGHPSRSAIRDAVKALNEKLSSVEEELIQVKIKSSQDPLNYPIKLNNSS
ncbi:MAG: glycosyl hydrolase, partial [Ignavibacteria bacterium]|nr:glycosyl hydrolase [Ignavibacteria bacterium]